MAGGTDGNWVLTKSKRTDTRANLTISNRDTNVVRFSSNKDWGELQTKYFELMTLFCQFALRENGEEKHWYKKLLELMPKDDSSSV